MIGVLFLVFLFAVNVRNEQFNYADFVCTLAEKIKDAPSMGFYNYFLEDYLPHITNTRRDYNVAKKIRTFATPLLSGSCTSSDRARLIRHFGSEDMDDSQNVPKLLDVMVQLDWKPILNLNFWEVQAFYNSFYVFTHGLTDNFDKILPTSNYAPLTTREVEYFKKHLRIMNFITRDLQLGSEKFIYLVCTRQAEYHALFYAMIC